MTQAILERPVKSAKRAVASVVDTAPYEFIARQFVELRGGMDRLIELDQGNCVGRVFEHANKVVMSAIEIFTSNEENDVDSSYNLMLDAESLALAGAALAAQDCAGLPNPNPRCVIAKSLGKQAGVITTAMDQYLLSFAMARKVAGTPAPAKKTVQAKGLATELELNAILEKISNRIYSCEAIIAMLIYVYGGEMERNKRPADSEAYGLYRTLYSSAVAVRELAKQRDSDFPPLFWDAVFATEAITQTLENVLSDNDLENPFGDATMDGLFMAMKDAFADITSTISPLFAKP